jgi:hypothetical protein
MGLYPGDAAFLIIPLAVLPQVVGFPLLWRDVESLDGPYIEFHAVNNDCVEARWGAPERSDEAATCKRHASSTQRAKMSEYRAWFHERRRPPRA